MGNSCATGAYRGAKKGSDLAPSSAKGGLNQGSDVPPPPEGDEANQVSDEAPSTAAHKWRVDGFSSLLEKGKGPTSSNVFQMKGLNWRLILDPRDTKSGDQNEYVSLQLQLVGVRSHTIVETNLKFLIYDQSFGKHHEQQVSHKFETGSTFTGTSCMIPLAALKERSSGFLVNNSCVFTVKFIAVAKAKDESETLFVQKTNNDQVYTWNIEDFFVLQNPSNSPEFELCGHKWSMKIYPSGDDDTNGNYLSLYLVRNGPETLDENLAYLIANTISIKTQETGEGLARKGRSEYSKNYYNWGWSKFISLEDFKDPANGYLVKTKCCIEVEVAVIGSSKTK
ncbi:hypothetical protein ACQ4PT_039553 [Festuca glaucescens]